jgi:hypothetical protein
MCDELKENGAEDMVIKFQKIETGVIKRRRQLQVIREEQERNGSGSFDFIEA